MATPQKIHCVVLSDLGFGNGSASRVHIDRITNQCANLVRNENGGITDLEGMDLVCHSPSVEDFARGQLTGTADLAPDVALIIYSQMHRSSFESVVTTWFPLVAHYLPTTRIVVACFDVEIANRPDAQKTLAGSGLAAITRMEETALCKNVFAVAREEYSVDPHADIGPLFHSIVKAVSLPPPSLVDKHRDAVQHPTFNDEEHRHFNPCVSVKLLLVGNSSQAVHDLVAKYAAIHHHQLTPRSTAFTVQLFNALNLSVCDATEHAGGGDIDMTDVHSQLPAFGEGAVILCIDDRQSDSDIKRVIKMWCDSCAADSANGIKAQPPVMLMRIVTSDCNAAERVSFATKDQAFMHTLGAKMYYEANVSHSASVLGAIAAATLLSLQHQQGPEVEGRGRGTGSVGRHDASYFEVRNSRSRSLNDHSEISLEHAKISNKADLAKAVHQCFMYKLPLVNPPLSEMNNRTFYITVVGSNHEGKSQLVEMLAGAPYKHARRSVQMIPRILERKEHEEYRVMFQNVRSDSANLSYLRREFLARSDIVIFCCHDDESRDALISVWLGEVMQFAWQAQRILFNFTNVSRDQAGVSLTDRLGVDRVNDNFERSSDLKKAADSVKKLILDALHDRHLPTKPAGLFQGIRAHLTRSNNR